MVAFNKSSKKIEATDWETNPEETEVVAEQKEFLTEIVNVENCGSLKDRPLDQRLPVRSHQRKKRAQGNGRSRKKLFTNRKRIICLVPAVRKGHVHKSSDKGSLTKGILNERTL
jgi:hypothetical protein